MQINWKLLSILVVASVVAACGGGGSDSTPRGAIAVNPSTGVGAISVNYSSQPEANSDAVFECGGASVCAVVREFSGYGECGSLARGTNGVWGVGSAGSKEEADNRATASCAGKGGSACLIQLTLGTQCN
ncbi:MAG TPA: hypothetical protein DCY64_13265 [Hydrogenophaga sp.]|uniref:DUF4189 domain-containing protein n=1 Tax=Hydrogenophaga sp. TaxID=1904254 RepID=UPI000E869123|nr:hypothetical protein [Hydrogenophaga sp.]HBU17168.1 hypothetical protein [Hydrogenophaga sp.]